jgi:F-type H+-transporting ATPase subunit delta
MSAVVRRYATALFEVAKEAGGIEAFVTDIEKVASAFAVTTEGSSSGKGESELLRVLLDPSHSAEAKRSVLREVCQRLGVGGLPQHSVLYMLDRRRIEELPAVARELRKRLDSSRGVLHAEVTSAVRMSDDFYTRLQAQLESITRSKVVLHKREDPSLIAGVITRMGDFVLDGSLRARLEGLRTALLTH